MNLDSEKPRFLSAITPWFTSMRIFGSVNGQTTVQLLCAKWAGSVYMGS